MRLLIARIRLWWHCLTHLHQQVEIREYRWPWRVLRLHCHQCDREFYRREP